MTTDMFSSFTVKLHAMTALELEHASGLTAELQRVWRNRGIIEKKKGTRATYDAFDIAAFSLTMVMKARGCSSQEALQYGRQYAACLVQLALFNVDGTIELIGTEKFVRNFRDEMNDRGEILTARLAGLANSEAPPVLVSADNGPYEGVWSVPDMHRLSGPISLVAIDLVTLAMQFANRLGRPLIAVQEKHENTGVVVTRKVLEAPRAK